MSPFITFLFIVSFIVLAVIFNIFLYKHLHLSSCPFFKCNCRCKDCTTPIPVHAKLSGYTGLWQPVSLKCVCSECTRSQHCSYCCDMNRKKCDVCVIKSRSFFFWLYVIFTICFSLASLYMFFSKL